VKVLKYCLFEVGVVIRVATVVKQLLWRVRRAWVGVVATAEHRSRVHPQLVAARGRHAFTTFLHIPPLTKVKRNWNVRVRENMEIGKGLGKC
jgi:hypothetical protein